MISLVIPCYNEQAVIPLLYRRLSQAASEWQQDYEVIAIDDGSGDTTFDVLEQIHYQDPRWKVLRFSRNFGHQIAVSAGIHYAQGDCLAIMDADLQDPPEVLGQLLAKWQQGYDVVYAIRTTRPENVGKRLLYKVFYRLLRGIANIDIPVDSGDFCLIDRKVADILKRMPEHNRFVRGLRAWVGFRQIGVEYDRSSRIAGTTQYSLKKLWRLACDGLFAFSHLPLRLASYLGIIITIIAILAVISMWVRPIDSGQSSLATGLLLLGGVQLLCLGIVGEYLTRIYDEVRQRPLWVIAQAYGIGTGKK